MFKLISIGVFWDIILILAVYGVWKLWSFEGAVITCLVVLLLKGGEA